MAVMVSVIAQFLVGYNTSVMNAPESVVFPEHSTLMWSLAVSAFAVGGPGGSVVGGYWANTKGRKGAMDINNWIFLLGGIIMACAQNMYWLILARLIIGFASGVAMVVVPVYLGEIAPPTLRGTLGTCTQFAIVIGILASNIAAFPLATATLWRYLFMISPLLSVIQLMASKYLEESPRWLLNRDVNSLEARLAIKRLRAYRSNHEVEHEVQNYLFASARHKTARHSAHSTGAIWDLITAKDVRILLASSIVLQIAQQLSGINAVFYYSTTFFEGVIANPKVGTTLLGIVNLIATIAALKLMDNTERRTLLLYSSLGMLLSMLFIISALLEIVSKPFALIALMCFVTSFAIGLGPIPWLIVAELFDAKYVATAMSLACIVNWSCNFLVGLSFPFCNQYLGPYSFLPFFIVLLISTIYIYAYLPETHGRSVEEVYRIVTSNSKERSNHGPGFGLGGILGQPTPRRRKNTNDEFEEKLVDMPVIQAVEMLESYGADHQI
jgi:SP family facilitated glucose transporter-like MFS transporter 3